MEVRILLIAFCLFASCEGHKDLSYAISNELGEKFFYTEYFGAEGFGDSLEFKANEQLIISGGRHSDSDSTIFWTKDSKKIRVFRNRWYESVDKPNHFYNEENWITNDGFYHTYYLTPDVFDP